MENISFIYIKKVRIQIPAEAKFQDYIVIFTVFHTKSICGFMMAAIVWLGLYKIFFFFFFYNLEEWPSIHVSYKIVAMLKLMSDAFISVMANFNQRNIAVMPKTAYWMYTVKAELNVPLSLRSNEEWTPATPTKLWLQQQSMPLYRPSSTLHTFHNISVWKQVLNVTFICWMNAWFIASWQSTRIKQDKHCHQTNPATLMYSGRHLTVSSRSSEI